MAVYLCFRSETNARPRGEHSDYITREMLSSSNLLHPFLSFKSARGQLFSTKLVFFHGPTWITCNSSERTNSPLGPSRSLPTLSWQRAASVLPVQPWKITTNCLPFFPLLFSLCRFNVSELGYFYAYLLCGTYTDSPLWTIPPALLFLFFDGLFELCFNSFKDIFGAEIFTFDQFDPRIRKSKLWKCYFETRPLC